MKRRLLPILLALAPSLAAAQGVVTQVGPATPGDVVQWLGNGLVGDAGAGALLTVGTPVTGHPMVWAPNLLTGAIQAGDGGTALAPVMGSIGAIGQECLYSNAPGTGPYLQFCANPGTAAGNTVNLTATPASGYGNPSLTFTLGSNVVTLPSTSGILLNGVTAGTGVATAAAGSSPVISLASIPTNTVLANTLGSASPPASTTLSSLFDSVFGSTPGDMVWRSPSGWLALGPGANSTCLTYNTTGPAITWGSCAGSGGTGTVTSIATGSGLTGGTITTTGTVALASVANGTLLSNVSGSSAAPSANTLTGTIDGAIGSTRGSILERGSGGWALLTPGTANQIFLANGAGNDPSWASLSSTIDAALGSTRGSVLERSGSGWVPLTPGTAGYVLTSNGTGADPSYQSATTTSGQVIAALGYTPAANTTIGNVSGIYTYASSTVLTSTQCGALIEGLGTGIFTLTLPAASGVSKCQMIFVVPTTGGTAVTATVTLSSSGGQFYGASPNLPAATYSLAGGCGGGQVNVISDGSNWVIASASQGNGSTCGG